MHSTIFKEAILNSILEFFSTSAQYVVANISASILIALLSLLGAGIVRPKRPDELSYQDKLKKLTSTLHSSSLEIDAVLREITKVTLERHSAAESLKYELDQLSKSEQKMTERINTLKSVPIPVAEHFAKLMETGEKRSAKRDYLLFGLGVITSIISAIVLKALGVA